MNVDGQLQASFWVMVLLQTLGSVDVIPGGGSRKMPAPGVYVPAIVAWGVLQLVADAGFERGARAAGWVILLTGAVVGPFGTKLTGLFKSVSQLYSPVVTASTASGGASTTYTPYTSQA